ncbi:hypothetical protein [Anditalea andensis]|uniref:Membrane protein n=1 Tax=Anditalea andensis TaxID=1048983 RepID=A0A074KWW1_9BACT|nr:hypothetical protein [Anditalea andensis]KEO74471.1 membrane protein [Anditalea andensis]
MNKKSLLLLIEEGYEFDVENSLRKGWEIFSLNIINSLAYMMFIFSIQLMVVLYMPELMLLYSILVFPALICGFFLVANKSSQNEPVTYPDFFKGFKYYIPLVLINVVGQVLVALGIFVLILPGIFLTVSYMFAFLIALFAGTDFWQSLELSRKLIYLNFKKFFILFLLLVVLNVIGALILIGLLITVPFSMYVIYAAFETVTRNAVTEEE